MSTKVYLTVPSEHWTSSASIMGKREVVPPTRQRVADFRITLQRIVSVYNNIEKNEMGWACGAYGWGEGVYRVLVGIPEGKRPLGRPRRRWVDNIRMDLQEVGYGYMDWIGLAQDRDRWRTLVSAVMNLRVPWNTGNFLTSCKPVSCSRRTLLHGVSKYKISSLLLVSYYSGVSPCGFSLFSRLKRALNGHRNVDIETIRMAVTKELCSIPKKKS